MLKFSLYKALRSLDVQNLYTVILVIIPQLFLHNWLYKTRYWSLQQTCCTIVKLSNNLFQAIFHRQKLYELLTWTKGNNFQALKFKLC